MPMTPPDGIQDEHTRSRGRHWTNRVGVVTLSLLVGLSFLGIYGHEHTVRASGAGVAASVHLPELIRNGEFFEMQFEIDASESIADLRIDIPATLWRDMTVNTLIPAATDETSENGSYRFSYGPMSAGSTFVAKADVQINPDLLLGNAGEIGVYDGERLLVSLPVEIGVLP